MNCKFCSIAPATLEFLIDRLGADLHPKRNTHPHAMTAEEKILLAIKALSTGAFNYVCCES
jgi:hypothetical protein